MSKACNSLILSIKEGILDGAERIAEIERLMRGSFWRGEWRESSYGYGDIVSRLGSVYKSMADNNTMMPGASVLWITVPDSGIAVVESCEMLASIDTTIFSAALVRDADTGGVFVIDDNERWDGGIWFGVWRRVYNGDIHAAWFGAKGDSLDGLGGTDNTEYIQKAIDASVGCRLIIDDGWYMISRVYVDNPVDIRIRGRISSLDKTTSTSSNTMITIRSDDVSVVGGELRLGDQYPYYGLRVLEKQENVGHRNIRVEDVCVTGGKNGIKFENTEDLIVRNVRATGAHNGWALASRQGKRQLWEKIYSSDHHTDDVSIGGGDGLKISTDPDTLTEDIIIRDSYFANNSRDGIDMNLAAARRISIYGNTIRGNTLTGIELKKGVVSNLADAAYEDVIVRGNTIEMDDRSRSAINIQNSYPDEIYRRVSILGNRIKHMSDTADRVSGAVKIQSAKEITIADNDFVNVQNAVIGTYGARDVTIHGNSSSGEAFVRAHSGEVDFDIFSNRHAGSASAITIGTATGTMRIKTNRWDIPDGSVSIDGDGVIVLADNNDRGAADAVPSVSGSRGDVVYNTSPDSGEPLYWKYIGESWESMNVAG